MPRKMKMEMIVTICVISEFMNVEAMFASCKSSYRASNCHWGPLPQWMKRKNINYE